MSDTPWWVGSASVHLRNGESEAMYWCCPYCPAVHATMAARSRHRSNCEDFARFAREVRRQLEREVQIG